MTGPKYHPEMIQGSDEWLQARCGLLTASEVHKIVTPTLKVANNDKTRAHVYELLAQRITNYVEPHYVSDDMLRGHSDEVDARIKYSEKCAGVQDGGFITNDKWGFTIGYSPDGLVGSDGLIETKSRVQKYQVQTIIEHVALDAAGSIPADYVLQVQTGLMVSERQWLDFISYSGGLPMVVIRVYPDPVIQEAIITAAAEFEAKIAERMALYRDAMASYPRMFPTERKIYQEMF